MSQSALFSGTPDITVLCRSLYSGHARHPASSLSHVRASTSSDCLMAARWAITEPVNIASIPAGSGLCGVETQLGGPNVLLYAGLTLFCVCLGA